MDAWEMVSSRMQPKHVTQEYVFILMSLYWMFSGFEFFILCLLVNKIDLVLSSPRPYSRNKRQCLVAKKRALVYTVH